MAAKGYPGAYEKGSVDQGAAMLAEDSAQGVSCRDRAEGRRSGGDRRAGSGGTGPGPRPWPKRMSGPMRWRTPSTGRAGSAAATSAGARSRRALRRALPPHGYLDEEESGAGRDFRSFKTVRR